MARQADDDIGLRISDAGSGCPSLCRQFRVQQRLPDAPDGWSSDASGGEAQIPLIIFESQVSEIQSRNLDIEDFKDRKVQVVGTITEYNSDLELILSNGDSLRIIN